jgi:hypothetical protein
MNTLSGSFLRVEDTLLCCSSFHGQGLFDNLAQSSKTYHEKGKGPIAANPLSEQPKSPIRFPYSPQNLETSLPNIFTTIH